MLNPQVVTYIRDQLSMGVHPDVIKQNLKQGGGWTDEVIGENFNAANNASVNVADIPKSNMQDNKIRQRIALANILIFALYTVIGVLAGYTEMTYSAYFGHAGVLVVISLVFAIMGFVTKKKMFAIDYFLVAILICIIGFGTCTVLAMTGVSGF